MSLSNGLHLVAGLYAMRYVEVGFRMKEVLRILVDFAVLLILITYRVRLVLSRAVKLWVINMLEVLLIYLLVFITLKLRLVV